VTGSNQNRHTRRRVDCCCGDGSEGCPTMEPTRWRRTLSITCIYWIEVLGGIYLDCTVHGVLIMQSITMQGRRSGSDLQQQRELMSTHPSTHQLGSFPPISSWFGSLGSGWCGVRSSPAGVASHDQWIRLALIAAGSYHERSDMMDTNPSFLLMYAMEKQYSSRWG
jgi:hypothetical protein